MPSLPGQAGLQGHRHTVAGSTGSEPLNTVTRVRCLESSAPDARCRRTSLPDAKHISVFCFIFRNSWTRSWALPLFGGLGSSPARGLRQAALILEIPTWLGWHGAYARCRLSCATEELRVQHLKCPRAAWLAQAGAHGTLNLGLVRPSPMLGVA